jgi:hypothetical protein
LMMTTLLVTKVFLTHLYNLYGNQGKLIDKQNLKFAFFSIN